MRQTILDLSAGLFARHGFRATSLQLVADELSLTRQALYYHFPSKGHILVALFDRMMSRMENAIDNVADDPRVPRFVILMRAHIDVILGDADLVAVLLHERPELAKLRRPDVRPRRNAYTQRFISAYEAGRAAGQLRDLDAWTAVNTLLSAANVLSTWYRPGRSPRSRKQMAHDTSTVLLAGVWAGHAPG